MQPFISHLAHHTALLCKAMGKGKEFYRYEARNSSFKQRKCLVSNSFQTNLTYYDRQQPVSIQVEAPEKGLETVILHDNRPVAFTKKPFSNVKMKYTNIECELLAVVFTSLKFHTYIYGCRFFVEFDHKSLVIMYFKNLVAAPSHLSKLLLILQPYDVTITYRSGK